MNENFRDHACRSLRNRLSEHASLCLAVVVAFVAFAAYVNSLPNSFVWDDVESVPDSNHLLSLGSILISFFGALFDHGNGGYYRPMISLFYNISAFVSNGAPWSFHLFNILLHGAVSALVFLISNRLLGSYPPFAALPVQRFALASGLLFAVHPIHSESVAWVSGITDLSYSFFGLLAFYLYLRTTSRKIAEGSAGFSILSMASLFLATLCKEPAVTLPLIFVVSDFAFGEDSSLSLRLRDLVKRHAPYFLVVSAYFLMRIHALSGLALTGRDQALAFEGTAQSGLSNTASIINVFPLFARYLGKLVFPAHLSAFHPPHLVSSLLEPIVAGSLAITLLFALLSIVAIKKARTFFFAMALIVVPLVPALNYRATGTTTFAERYLYLSSFGFILLLILTAGRVALQWRKAMKPLAVGCGVLLCLYTVGTVTRNLVWRNNLTLWSDVVAKAPESAIAHYNLAHELKNLGRLDEAIEQYRIVVGINPKLAGGHMNLGNAYYAKELFTLAITELETAVRLEPANAEARFNLGTAYLAAGSMDRAVEQLEICMTIQPDQPSVRNNLGMAYLRTGRPVKAAEQFAAAVALRPDNRSYRINLANSRAQSESTKESGEQKGALPGH